MSLFSMVTHGAVEQMKQRIVLETDIRHIRNTHYVQLCVGYVYCPWVCVLYMGMYMY